MALEEYCECPEPIEAYELGRRDPIIFCPPPNDACPVHGVGVEEPTPEEREELDRLGSSN